MKYTIYETKCLLDRKRYIGKHQTEDAADNYLGSGKHLKNAISKYGVKNFKKKILFIFETEDEMNVKERELVTEEFCRREDTYNICEGGKGGWSYINREILNLELRKKIGLLGGAASVASIKTGKHKDNIRRGAKKRAKKATSALLKKYPNGTFFMKKHSDKTKLIMSIKAKKWCGEKHSQFGSRWMNNGVVCLKSKKEDVDYYLKSGYVFGRSL